MYLDYENQEKGYKKFELTKENIRANVGKQICYVDKRTIDRYRGYYNVDYGIIHSVKYSRLFLDDANREVDVRDVVECGIKI